MSRREVSWGESRAVEVKPKSKYDARAGLLFCCRYSGVEPRCSRGCLSFLLVSVISQCTVGELGKLLNGKKLPA